MPLMLLLPFFPLATVLMGMVVVTSVKFTEFECADIVKDTLECDGCGCCCGCGCGCCTWMVLVFRPDRMLEMSVGPRMSGRLETEI